MPLTSRHDTEIDQLAAPADDGNVLIWPSSGRILELIEENRRLRGARRLELPGGASVPTGPLPIMTGHQPEMMHPGVWIKLIAAARLARKTNRKALFVCVDNDLTNGIPLARPVRVDDRWRSQTTPLGSSATRTFEQEPVPSSDHWANVLSDPAIGGAESAWLVFKDAFLNNAVVSNDTKDYIWRWSRGINALTQACAETPIETIRVSQLFLPDAASAADPSYSFVAHLLLNAGAFAASYNRALAEYRERRGIRGDAHPIPNLALSADRIELPLWTWRGDAPRARLHVSLDAERNISLYADATPICTINAAQLRTEPVAAIRSALGEWRIRPRALVLTMYLRLFKCDLFIHGIGGAKYDTITDAIVRDFFQVEPPGYACVSATARLALEDQPSAASVDGVASARVRLRAARFNPQRLLANEAAQGELAAALAEREQWIREARNLRDSARQNRDARRTAFQRIRSANERIGKLRPDLTQEAERAVANALRHAEDRAVTHSREWFTGLYTFPQLRALCARLPW